MGDKKSAVQIDTATNAILIAGQLAGLAFRLDAAALEKFLESPPKYFRYEKECRAAIEFRKAIHG
jgi:hypothetical protein